MKHNRPVVPYIPVHVTQRGNRQEKIFKDDADKEFYINNFIHYKAKYKVKMHAWCLMDNHVHFVLEPKNKTGLSKLFGSLNTKYVKYFNKKYSTNGRLFGNRFYSCLLDEDHFYEAIRYVELNPYRANMETTIGTYRWSSIQEHLGKRNTYFLSKPPRYFQVTNWLDYITESLPETVKDEYKRCAAHLEEFWQMIKKCTFARKAAGANDFINKMSKRVGRDLSLKRRLVPS